MLTKRKVRVTLEVFRLLIQHITIKHEQIADEARARLEQALKDAETVRQQQMETAQADIQALYARHEAQLALEREQLRRELRQEMSDIAVQAAHKALRVRMTPELQAAVIDQVIAELDRTTLQ